MDEVFQHGTPVLWAFKNNYTMGKAYLHCFTGLNDITYKFLLLFPFYICQRNLTRSTLNIYGKQGIYPSATALDKESSIASM